MFIELAFRTTIVREFGNEDYCKMAGSQNRNPSLLNHTAMLQTGSNKLLIIAPCAQIKHSYYHNNSWHGTAFFQLDRGYAWRVEFLASNSLLPHKNAHCTTGHKKGYNKMDTSSHFNWCHLTYLLCGERRSRGRDGRALEGVFSIYKNWLIR